MNNGIGTASVRWKGTALIMTAAMMIAALLVFAPLLQSDAEEQHFDEEVTGYGYHPYIELRGLTQTEYVIWDFGDESEPVRVDVTEENPNAGVDHVFPAIGDYYVTATLYNTYDAGDGEQQGVTTKVLLYHIMGYPVVTFDPQNGSATSTYTGESSNYIIPEESRPADPVRTGYTFTGWYTEAACENLFDMATTGITKHTTLYAGWDANEYTITFDLGEVEGTAPESQTVEYGKLIQQPANPVDSSEDARTFLGWYYNDVLWSFTTPIEGDMTLVAYWSEPGAEFVTVTLDANGGTAGQASIAAEEGSDIVLPGASRDGFTFDGWFDGETRVGGEGDPFTVQGDVTLTAHWTEVAAPGDDDADDGERELMWLIGAIVCGILAVVCLAVALKVNEYAAIGTVVFAILAVVCALFYLEVI